VGLTDFQAMEEAQNGVAQTLAQQQRGGVVG